MILISTAYLPSIAYMAILAQNESVAIEQQETFPKQTFRNRAVIATGNGLQTLTVPIIRTQGNHTRTEELGISYQEPWQIRHWRAIVSAYSAAPYFLYYRDDIEKVLMQQHDRLIDLNDALLQMLMKKMKISCNIDYTQDYYAENSIGITDLRLSLTNKHSQATTPLPSYSQVFEERFGFQTNLTVLDLLFNMGPEAKKYLMNAKI